MNKQTLHTDPKHRYRLPSEVLDELAHESDEERTSLIEAWDLAGSFYGEEPSDADFRQLGAEIWQNLETVLAQEEPARQTATPYLRLVKAPLRLIKSKTLSGVAVAACITILLALGVFYLQRPVTITALNGTTIAHVLPDGSTLTLNSGTTIRYARDFGETNRQVELVDGEALFEVAKDPSKPFNITTFNGTVTVLGTTFNVRARPHDIEPATVVAVATGTVKLTPRHQENKAVILQAGQAALLTMQNQVPQALDSTDTHNALAWNSGAFKFRDHPLGTIIQEVERRFNVHIDVQSRNLLNEHFGIFNENPRGAEEILNDVCGLNRCQYRVVPGGFEIIPPAAE